MNSVNMLLLLASPWFSLFSDQVLIAADIHTRDFPEITPRPRDIDFTSSSLFRTSPVSSYPSSHPSKMPMTELSQIPTKVRSGIRSIHPSDQPFTAATFPLGKPSASPSYKRSSHPSVYPNILTVMKPRNDPTTKTSLHPSTSSSPHILSKIPSRSPTLKPTNRIEYPNGLVLANSTVLTISHSYVIFGGIVSITGDAKLIVYNSTIVLNMSGGPNSVVIVTYGNGALLFDNVQINQIVNNNIGCQISNWLFHDNSHVSFTNVKRGCNWMVAYGNVTYHSTGGNTGLTIDPAFHGNIDVWHETYVWFEIYLLPGHYSISNVPQQGDKFSSSTSPFFQGLLKGGMWRDSKINIVSCTMYEVDLGVTNHVHLSVSNSKSLSFAWSLGFGPRDIGYKKNETVRGLAKGYYSAGSWTLGNSSIALHNSTLKIWWGAFWWGSQIVFESCTMNDIAVSNSAIIWIEYGSFTSLSLCGSAQATISHVNLAKDLQPSSVQVTQNSILTVIDSPQITGNVLIVSGNAKVFLKSSNAVTTLVTPDIVEQAPIPTSATSTLLTPDIIEQAPTATAVIHPSYSLERSLYILRPAPL